MLRIVGKENCNRCEMVKNILNNKNIQFEYVMLNDLDEITKKDYMNEARKKGMLNMPLIIKENQLVELKEVIG